MGIKLMVEILDHWQDAGLTLGERSDLLVLAENANDGTRETWPKGGVHQEYMRKRAGKTAGSWKNAVAKLVKKGVLSYAVRDGRELMGFPGQAAVYRIAPLCPEAPHDGLMGQCTRSERSTPEVTQSEGDVPGKGHLPEGMGHLSDEKGHLSGGERSTPEVTPTPPYPSSKSPSTTSSTSPADPSVDVPQSDPEVTNGGGGGSDLRSTAIHIAASLDYRGKPPGKRLRQTIEDRLTTALTAGWSVYGLAVLLDISGQDVDYPAAVYAHRLDPTELPPAEPLSTPAPSFGGHVDTADGGLWERAMGRARERMAAGSGGGTDRNMAAHFALRDQLARQEHKPYSNPRDDSIYDEPWTYPAPARPPWCGHWDCDEKTRMRDVEDAQGFKYAQKCPHCHPDVSQAA